MRVTENCDTCGGRGIVRTFYRTIDWYRTRSEKDGEFYYMDAWDDKSCPKCQPAYSLEKRTIIKAGGDE